MARSVSRGIFGVTARGAKTLKPGDPEEVAARAADILTASKPDAYQMRERKDLMQRLVNGGSDIHGRRLFTDAALADARYIIRYVNQRLRFIRAESDRYIINLTERDVTERQSELVRSSLRRIYEALEAGKPVMEISP